jgi:rhamnosyltransferase
MKPVCSIVIRAFNEEKHIGRLLEGLGHQTINPIQIILVDSGSTDSTVEIACHFPVELVQIQPQEFTFGRSLNLGIQHAHSDLVAIASAHVYPVYPDWLEKLLLPFDDPRIALAYGKQRGSPSSKFSEHQIFRHWFPDVSNHWQPHPFCNNANAAIRLSLWNEHPYHETLPGLEDLGWARWAHDQGYGISYVAEAEVIHIHHETWKGVFNRYRREGMAFKQIYPQETFHRRDLVRLWFGNVVNDLKEANRQRILMKQLIPIMCFRWQQFWGTYCGFRQSGPLTWQLKQAFYYPSTETTRHEGKSRAVAPIPYTDAHPPGK